MLAHLVFGFLMLILPAVLWIYPKTRRDGGNWTIGKKRGEATLIIDDLSVSRIHARLFKEGEDYYLEDLNSTNGTFKNGVGINPFEKRKLAEFDEIKIGKINVDTYWLAAFLGACVILISGSVNAGELFSKMTDNSSVNPIKILVLFISMTVSSVAYICSPPFVPMMAAAMKNRSVLAGGLAVGVVGYAAGNYLGFLMAQLLGLF